MDPNGLTGNSAGSYERITPLRMTIENVLLDESAIGVLRSLLEGGASPNKWCFNQRDHPLHDLIYSPYSFYVKTYWDWLNSKGHRNEHWTAVMVARRNEVLEALDTLLRFGANLESQNVRGWTPLLTASHLCLTLPIEDLHDRGANLLAVDKFGRDVYQTIEMAHGGRKKKIRASEFVRDLYDRHYCVDMSTGEVVRRS